MNAEPGVSDKLHNNMFNEARELGASEVARRLRVSHGRATELMRSGAIGARRLPSGAWLTSFSAVEVYEATAQRGRGRTLAPASAWAILWELSGIRPSWVQRSTLSRLRAELAGWSAVDVVRAVSGRTVESRFTRAGPHAGDGLIATGRTVAGILPLTLKHKPEVITGYPRVGSVAQHARLYNMTPDYEGANALLENTLPIAWDVPHMPAAVIAADLARSPIRHERERAIHALTQLKAQWLATPRRP